MLFYWVAGYLLFTVLIGLVSSRLVKNSRDFMIAGQSLPLLITAPSLFATWFGSETVIGASSEFAEKGVPGVIEDPFGAALCLLLIGFFFARKMYNLGMVSIGDFYRERFGRKTELVSSVLMIVSYFGWIAAQLVALGILLNVLTGISVSSGVLAGTAVVVIYTNLGGMWAISIADFFQTILIIAGLSAIAYQFTGEAGGIAAVTSSAPDHFYNFLPEGNTLSWFAYAAAWITIGLGSIPQQDVFQRIASARSANTAVHASFLSSFLYLTVALLPLLIVLCGRTLDPQLIRQAQESDGQLTLVRLIMTHAGFPLQVLFFGALLSAILSTASAAILAPSTVLSENLIKPLTPGMSDKNFLRLLRLSVLLITGISLGFALTRGNIYALVAESSAISLVSLFVPLTAGLYWKKATGTGALWAIIAGTTTWLFALSINTAIPPLLYGFAASIAGMLGGSLIRPKSRR